MAEEPLTVAVWYEALASLHGISLETEKPDEFKQQLYKLRDQAGDPELWKLEVRTSTTSPHGEVWIVKPHKA